MWFGRAGGGPWSAASSSPGVRCAASGPDGNGPLNAGAFPVNALDGTFGPEQVFVKAPARANVSPAEGYPFYGEWRSTAAATS
jgi:hypothetical protein